VKTKFNVEFFFSPDYPSVFCPNCLITLNVMSKLGMAGRRENYL